MTKTFLKILLLVFSLNISGQKLRTVSKYFKYADTLKYEDNKYTWLDEKKEFYPNGQLKTYLHMAVGDNPRDTSYFLKYELNDDSTAKCEREYRSYQYGWIGKSTFVYTKGNKNPVELKDDKLRGQKVTYEYNSNHNLIRSKSIYHKQVNSETEWVYDSLGRLQQKILYHYHNGIKQRYFTLNNYRYTKYDDSIVCIMNNYTVFLLDSDSLRSEKGIPALFDLNKSQFYDDINTFCIVTTTNNRNEIISEKYFNKSIVEPTRGQMSLNLKYFYVYEYYE